VEFLLEDLLRAHWGPAPAPNPYAIARDDWPTVKTHLSEGEGGWSLSSPRLHVSVGLEGELEIRDGQGNCVLHLHSPRFKGERPLQVSSLAEDECLYGLGERAANLNLRPGTYRMWNRDPGGSYGSNTDPLYLCAPAYLGLHAQGSYLIFFENSHDAVFEFKHAARCDFYGPPLRYYIAIGDVQRCLDRFSTLTGGAPLPPRWSLGYHQSRWSYRNEGEIRDLARGFQEHDLPLSAVHLDLEYMRGYRVFTVDPDRFPDLPGLAHDLGEQGVQLIAILNPGVKQERGYTLFDQGMEQGVFAPLPDSIPVSAPTWPGWSVFPDFTDPQARSWWATNYPGLLDQGLRGLWHDMNEPSVFAAWGEPSIPLSTQHAMDGRGGTHREAHNLYALLMNKVGFSASREHRPDQRPFLLSRSGWVGVGRYAWVWTGDTESSWHGLRGSIPTLLGLGLSGIPFCGCDIGGFLGHPSDELFVRWFQLGVFTPFFRTHSSVDSPPREPWRFRPSTLAIIRQQLAFRYRLLPYLYTCAWEASQTGAPMMRPLFWVDTSPAYREIQDCFLLGDALLVAPILRPGGRHREVPLPAGDWYDFWSDEPFEGGQVVQVNAPLDRCPLFARAGAVVPLEVGDRLELHLYAPARGSRGSVLYSDSGDGYGRERLDRFTLEPSQGGLNLRWESSGDYPFPYAEVQIIPHGIKAQVALLDQEETPLTDGSLTLRSPVDDLRLVSGPPR
jgi:alpha-glucosidase